LTSYAAARHNLSNAIELVMSRLSLDRRSGGMAIKDVRVVLARRAWADIKLGGAASANIAFCRRGCP